MSSLKLNVAHHILPHWINPLGCPLGSKGPTASPIEADAKITNARGHELSALIKNTNSSARGHFAALQHKMCRSMMSRCPGRLHCRNLPLQQAGNYLAPPFVRPIRLSPALFHFQCCSVRGLQCMLRIIAPLQRLCRPHVIPKPYSPCARASAVSCSCQTLKRKSCISTINRCCKPFIRFSSDFILSLMLTYCHSPVTSKLA